MFGITMPWSDVYTVDIKTICENKSGFSDVELMDKSVDEIITAAMPKVFDFEFPIFDEAYRATLERKILKHYYTRQIGLETYGLWKLKLNDRLNLIMPYYNQLYKSELLKFDPLLDFDYTETHEGHENKSLDRKIMDDSSNEMTRTENTTTEKTGNQSGTDNRETDSTEDNKDKSLTTNDLTETMKHGEIVNGETSSSNSGTDQNTKTTNDQRITTDSALNYDAMSDTPQGSLSNAKDMDYLTTVTRHDIDDTVNDTLTGKVIDETVHGLKVSGTSNETHSGTDTGTNTGTVDYKGETLIHTTGTDNLSFSHQDSENGTKTVAIGEKGESSKDHTLKDTIVNTDDYIRHLSGKRNGMSYAKMLQEFRETFLNIDLEIVRRLEDLFMMLW